MSREFFGIEKGLDIYAENGDVLARVLTGTAAPDGLLDQAASPIGSLYLRSGTGELYQKIANAGNASDWVLNGASSASIGLWRSEKIQALTNDIVSVGVRDLVASPFADDDAPLMTAANFTVGDFIISDADGTPVLLEVTAVSAPNVTFAAPATAPALATNDTFIANNYLPDSPGTQEGKAIANFNGSIMIKLGDIDWDFATGINISTGYTPTNGTVSSADSVESAIEKLDANQQDLTTLSGLGQGSVDNGLFAGNIITDNVDTKTALSELETAVELKEDKNVVSTTVPVSTPTVIDTVLVDAVQAFEYELVCHDIVNPDRVKIVKIEAIHNGHAGADALSVKDKIFAKMHIGNVNLQVDVILSGAGAAQTMGLQITTNEASGIKIEARRTDVAAL